MLEAWLELVERVDTGAFVVSAALFAVGYLAAYPVTRVGIDALTWYPLWLWKRVMESISPEDAWLKLFVFLFAFNSLSLLANFLSGFLVVLPYVFAVLLGLNIGVIAVEEAGGWGMVGTTLLNPVAWIELPAAFASLAAGIQLGGELYSGGLVAAADAFPPLAEVYLYVVLPLLLAAALLESTLIWLLPSGSTGTPVPEESAVDIEGEIGVDGEVDDEEGF